MAMQDFSRSLPIMLYRTLDAVMPRFRQIFNEYGLTEQQWRVLRVLWEQESIAFSELSALTLIPEPSLVGVIDRLTSNGLVARRRSTTYLRSVLVYATDEGQKLEAEVRPRVDQAYAELRASMERDSWETLIAGLEQISSIEQSTE